MFNACDFINRNVESKQMKFGWNAAIRKGISGLVIVLDYTMLNFDWCSIEFLDDDSMNMFLSSPSFACVKTRLGRAMKKFGRLHFEAYSIADLKSLVEQSGLKINIDCLIEKKIKTKSALLTEKLKRRTLA